MSGLATESAARGSRAARRRILLLVDSPDIRAALSAWLNGDFELVEGLSDEALDTYFDLCIFDTTAYERLWHRLEERRLQSEPVFLPFVLIGGEAATTFSARLPTHAVDELLVVPIDSTLLRMRIEPLLARREREIDLARERDEVLARLEVANRRLNYELERMVFLQQAAAATATSLELRTMCERVLLLTRERLGACRGSIFLADDSSEILVHLAEFGYPSHYRTMTERLPIDESTPVGRAVLRRTILTHENTPHENLTEVMQTISAGDKRWVAMPITTRNEVIGALVLAFDERRGFDEGELSLYQSLVDLLGIAMLNARLYEDEREAARLRAVLDEVSRLVHSSLEFDEIMRRSVEESADALGADAAVVAIFDGECAVVRFAYGLASSEVGAALRIDESDSLRRLSRQRRQVRQHGPNADQAVGEFAQRLGVQSQMLTPLIVRGRFIGWLGFYHVRQPWAFTDMQADFAERLAAQVSLALENSELYQTERHIADTLQSALLVLPEHITGISFAHEYRSATEAARVGGDFYDVFDLGRGRVGLLIGDVSGKGLKAAVMTSLARNAVRAFAVEYSSPASVLERTSQIMLATTAPETFVSTFFGILNLRKGVIQYTNAGHPHPLLLRTDGVVQPLETTGPVLGACNEVSFGEAAVSVCLGDLLVAFTDGVTEARRGRDLYGDDRVREVLAKQRPSSAREALSALLGSVEEFAAHDLTDDLAILTVRLDMGDIRPIASTGGPDGGHNPLD